MSNKANEYLALLLAALSEPIGLLVAASDAERARQKFYSARKASGNPALAALQIRISPFPDGQLVICKERILIPQTKEKDS